jgi:hypothetical protein
MIRFLKERLSIAVRANGDGRWVVHLPGILADHNAQLIKGTRIRRNSVDQNNYLDLVGKLYKSTEPSMLFNMAEPIRAPSKLARFLWRYAVGDRVMLARRVDYDLKDKTYFEKPSVKGAFGPKVYTVTACRVKMNSAFFLNPVYQLSQLTGLYYESELSPALFTPRAPQPPPPQQQSPPSTPRRRRRRRAGL